MPKLLAQLLAIDEDRAEITLERNSNIDSTSFKTNQGKIDLMRAQNEELLNEFRGEEVGESVRSK